MVMYDVIEIFRNPWFGLFSWVFMIISVSTALFFYVKSKKQNQFINMTRVVKISEVPKEIRRCLGE
jgi:hypothetical protein